MPGVPLADDKKVDLARIRAGASSRKERVSAGPGTRRKGVQQWAAGFRLLMQELNVER